MMYIDYLMQISSYPPMADNELSKNKLDIRMGDSLVMLSRSEASRHPASQTLRFAQGDKRGADFTVRLILLIGIIGTF
jgi:hypothetical protein